jgi:hypothetical protein
MHVRTHISGRYVRSNIEFLERQAKRNDPRCVFYAAMLRHNTYEAYLADVGQVAVEIPNKVVNPITGRMEILYARRNGWIADVK